MRKSSFLVALIICLLDFSCKSIATEQLQSHQPRRPIVLVYQGPGTFDAENSDPHVNTKALKAFIERYLRAHGKLGVDVIAAGAKEMNQYLADTDSREIAMIAFPGGPDPTLMYNTLKKNKTLTPIINYLLQGGRYLGICAGAFLASSYVDDSPDKSAGRPSIIGLGLLQPRSSSPNDQETVTEFESGLADSEALERGNVYFWRDKSVNMYFQNGPAFHFDESSAHVLARYQTPSRNVKTRDIIFPEDRFPPAALVLSYGAGQSNVGLFGMHPEAPLAWRKAAAMPEVSNEAYDALGFDLLSELLP